MEMLFSQEEVWEMTKREIERDSEQRGETKNMKSTALRMLAAGKYVLEEIAEITGLSIGEVKKLQVKKLQAKKVYKAPYKDAVHLGKIWEALTLWRCCSVRKKFGR